MSESEIKSAFLVLAQDVVRHLEELSESHESYSGRTAYFDTAYDQRITSRSSFSRALSGLDSVRLLHERYGPEAGRLTMQFIYDYLTDLRQRVFNNETFEAAWSRFWDEFQSPEWTYVGIANLQNFRSGLDLIDLGDGITVRSRSFEDLGRLLRWNERTLNFTLGEDWSSGAHGTHVLLTQHSTPKTPDNFVLTDAVNVTNKIQRVLLALRLFKVGDVRVGRIFLVRPAGFKVIGGISSTGFTVWNPGLEYQLEESEVESVRAIYSDLVEFDTNHSQVLRNIGLALRSFNSIYDRYLNQAEDRIIDAVTALEGILRIDSELSFRLAFRVAEIIATSDDERIEIFDNMRDYYDARSRIVHGGVLRERDLSIIRNDEPLRQIVRQLIKSFMRLIRSTRNYPNDDFYSQLDRTLLHGDRRLELRRAMGLS